MTCRAIDILKEGTTDPSVAKNWHYNGVIEDALKEIKSCKELDASLVSVGSEPVCSAEIREFQNLVDAFLMRFPAPTIRMIEDKIDVIDPLPAKWALLPTERTRPAIPLICRNDIACAPYIIYESPLTGDIHKVYNTHNNGPNKLTVKTYIY
jgi:hypothetical protein